MKNKLTKWVAVASAAAMAVTMMGCGAEEAESRQAGQDTAKTEQTDAKNTEQTGTDEDVTVKFWHTYGDSEEEVFLNTVLPLWEQKYPNIKIEAVRQDSSNYHQMVVTGFGTGDVPDVARIDIVNTASYAAQGGLVALSDNADFDSIRGDYLDGPLSTNFYQGKYYGLPLDTNCKAAVVNMNTMQELGLTEMPEKFEDFISAAKTRDSYSISVSGVGDWDLYPYFWLLGGTLTNDDYTKASGYLDGAESVTAMNKLIELHDSKVLTIRDVDGTSDAWDGISTGEYAMFFEGPWYFGSYEDKAGENIYPEVIPSYNGKSASVVGGENIVVFSTSKHADAAYEFAKFMTSKEVQLAMLDAGQLPVRKDLVEDEAVTGNPVWSVYMKQMESACARIPSPNHTAIGEIWSDALTNIFVNGADVQSELTNAAALIDAQLQ